MSVDVVLTAARECSYCARGGALIDDGEGGWMHADPAHCLAPETTRIAGVVVPLDALDAAAPETSPAMQVQAIVALVLAGDDVDPAGEDERTRLAVCRAMRVEVARAHERIARALRALPHLAGNAALGAIERDSVAAHAILARAAAWERGCNSVRSDRARAGQRRARS